MQAFTGKILVVEDERTALKNLEHVMRKEGYQVTGTMSGSNALRLLDEQEFDVVLTDLRMEQVDGLEVLERSKRLQPDAEVVMITAYATIPSAVETMKKGAFDYIAKPFKLDEVRKVVGSAMERVRLRKENAQLREHIERYEGKVKIITQNPALQGLLETARQIAPTDASVLITGESGTGKELFARYIHLMSKRAEGPFFAINCGALTEELLSNELFGHEKGAFTGATSMKKGLIEASSGGTLFLDEITEMSPAMQVKLLRVLQEKELLRLGSTEPVPVDVRVIAATNADVQEAINDGRFRQDLYFRLNVISIHIPPLAERRDDIPLLCQYFLRKYSALMKKDVREVSPSVMELLMNYDFPGNVRELENIIERGVALSNGPAIELAHLPEDLKALNVRTFRRKDERLPTLEEQEIAYIRWVLKETGGNKTQAAQMLGIDRVSLWRKMKKFGLDEEA
ncbi:MAG: sigma-54 dependent transcriptional regulator [Nitrospirota bacterium]|jgi:DNA-binding NtrC family response regulator